MNTDTEKKIMDIVSEAAKREAVRIFDIGLTREERIANGKRMIEMGTKILAQVAEEKGSAN
jgi:hypothetical protein